MPLNMGNQESTNNFAEGETEAYSVIKYVPLVGSIYSVPRIMYGAVQGDSDLVIKSATGLGGNLVETGLVLGAMVFGPAALGGALAMEMAASVSSVMMWKGVESIENKMEKISELPEMVRGDSM